jgi:phosphoglycolate phosphatase
LEPGVRGLLFDLDMTLVETWQDIAASTNAVRVQLGLRPLPRETVKGFIGDGVEKLVERALADAVVQAPAEAAPPAGAERQTPRDAAARARTETPPRARLDDAVARFREHYGLHCLDESRPYEGIPELLRDLAHVPMAVVSNKIERFCRQVLAGVGLVGHFPVIVGGDTVGALKPDAKPVLEAARRIGVSVQQCVMIGDTLRDVMAGRNAGCRVIAVTYGLVPRRTLAAADPDALADTPREVGEWISRWS